MADMAGSGALDLDVWETRAFPLDRINDSPPMATGGARRGAGRCGLGGHGLPGRWHRHHRRYAARRGAAVAQGMSPEAGDVVLVRTGWKRRYATDNAR